MTLAEGEISELHVGLKGTMNALFLKDLAAKTYCGLRGRVEKVRVRVTPGSSFGSLCWFSVFRSDKINCRKVGPISTGISSQ